MQWWIGSTLFNSSKFGVLSTSISFSGSPGATISRGTGSSITSTIDCSVNGGDVDGVVTPGPTLAAAISERISEGSNLAILNEKMNIAMIE